MPPLYDNIVDAFSLIQDGASHTQDFDTTGATMETNESTDFYNFEEVWAKIDLSDFGYSSALMPAGVNVTIKAETISGSVIPEVDLIRVTDATFDPSSPDFSKVAYAGSFLGDGTTTPSELVWNIDPADSATGIFYLWISDWNFDSLEVGVQRLTYTVELPIVSVEVDTSDWNHASGTVTDLGSGIIQDSQVTGGSIFEATYTFRASGAQLPPNGRYLLQLLGQFTDEGEVRVSIKRNGLLLAPYSRLLWGHTGASSINEWLLSGVNDFSTIIGGTRSWGPGPTTTPVIADDVFEIAVVRETSFGAGFFNISGIRFTQQEAGGHAGQSLDLVSIPSPLGSDDIRDDPTNEQNIICKDFCITNNGDIYVAYISLKPSGTAHITNYNIKLLKWNGSTWSTISNDLSHFSYGTAQTHSTTNGGITRYTDPYETISIDTDGTNVFIAWGEVDFATTKNLLTFGGATVTAFDAKWYCKKYTPGTGFSDLGSGTNAKSLASRTNTLQQSNLANNVGQNQTGIQIRVSPGGVPWVATSETDDTFVDGLVGQSTIPYVYKWNGSAWIDTSLPGPPGQSASLAYIVNYIAVDPMDQVCLVFAHHDGVNENPSAIYSVNDNWTSNSPLPKMRFIYAEYDGSSWGNIVDQQSVDIWPGGTLYERDANPDNAFGHAQQGMSLGFDGANVIFAAALWNNAWSDWVKVAKLKIDGSAFESYYTELSGPDITFRDDQLNIANGSGGWIDPTGCQMAIDEVGVPWIVYTMPTADFLEYGLALTRPGEPGTHDYWILGTKDNAIFNGEDVVGFSKIKTKDNYVYILVFIADTETGLRVYKCPKDQSYSPWIPGPGGGILAYYKDGAWHPVNSEASRDLYYYKDGVWHQKDDGLQVHKDAMWQP